MDPGQIGMGIQNAFRQGSADRQEHDTRRAFSDYATNQTEENAARVAQYDTRLGMKLMDREDERAAAAKQAALANTQKFVKLAQWVETQPDKEAAYQQGLRIAQQAGLDVSTVPPRYDPAWMQDNLAFSQAFLSEPEKMTALMQNVAAMGYQPGTPEFQAEMKRQQDPMKIVALQPGGTVAGYTPGQGMQMMVVPNPGSAQPGAPAGGPQPGTEVGGYIFKGGNPNDRNNWAPKGGAVSNGSGPFPGAGN